MYNHSPKNYICPFCLVAKGIENEQVRTRQIDIVYKDEFVTAFIGAGKWKNNPGNVIIIPNKHFENIYELPSEYSNKIHECEKQIALAFKKVFKCDGVSSRQHNEPAGNQDVWHYHLHVFPRYINDNLYNTKREIYAPEEREIYANLLREYLTKQEKQNRKGFESITEFIFMEDPLEKADIILVAGGSHGQVMDRAAELYLKGYSKYILPSGGSNIKLEEYETEWEFLKDRALKLGVPEEAILKEDKAKNTFHNAEYSYRVCKENNIKLDKVILVCKSFHSRRAYMTYKLFFPITTKFIVQPVVSNNGITKTNWMENERYINKVMDEVVKIGNYFKRYIED